MEQKDVREATTLSVDNLRVSIPGETEPLWTVIEVARYLKLEPETVRGMARRKELPGLKVGRVWRFRKAEVIQALELANNT